MAFEGKSEAEARQQILDLVSEYCDTYKQTKPFEPGDRINYAGRVFDHDEMVNLADATLEFWLTQGHWTNEFEKGIAKYVGCKYAAFVNSGSSANLLAFATLTAPELGDRAIKRGDEVITVACGFPTTITPAHTLGNPFDLAAVKAFCDEHDLWLVEDNCDALGTAYTLDGERRMTGSVGDLGTSSFYPPHHMTTGEGGAVYTNNPKLNIIMRSIRDWGRDCRCASGQDNLCGHRFDGQYGELPQGYDHKYVYSHLGYNLKATDLQASIGVAQLKKFPSFVERRKHNWAYLREALAPVEDRLILPEACPNSDPSWFGFLMTCREGVDRKQVVGSVETAGVQTRMLFSGNILRHPCFDSLRGTDAYRVVGGLENADRITNDTFWVGVYPGMTDEKLDYMAQAIIKAVEE